MSRKKRRRAALDERLNLRLPATVKSRVEQRAKVEDRTLTSMVRRLVNVGLDVLERKEVERQEEAHG